MTPFFETVLFAMCSYVQLLCVSSTIKKEQSFDLLKTDKKKIIHDYLSSINKN